jgi:hypothetical protein
MGTPYVAWGNEDLECRAEVHAGQSILCPRCLGYHELRACDDGNEVLLWYRCGENIYIGAIKNRLVAGVKPTYSGEVS